MALKKTFKTYLESIGMKEPLIGRVDTLLELAEQLSTEKISDIFVSEYVKDDKRREYENVWFLSENFVVEAKHFANRIDLDCAPIPQSLLYWQMVLREYDLKSTSEESRLNLNYKLGEEMGLTWKASGNNCDRARALFMKYLNKSS